MARAQDKYQRKFYSKRSSSSVSTSETDGQAVGSDSQEATLAAALEPGSLPPASASAAAANQPLPSYSEPSDWASPCSCLQPQLATQASASSSSAPEDRLPSAPVRPDFLKDLHLPMERTELQKLLDSDSESGLEAPFDPALMTARQVLQVRSPGILAVPSAGPFRQPAPAATSLPVTVPWNHRMVPAPTDVEEIDSGSDDMGPLDHDHVYLPGYGLEDAPRVYPMGADFGTSSSGAHYAAPCDSQMGQAIAAPSLPPTPEDARPEVMKYMVDRLSAKADELAAAEERAEEARERETLLGNIAFSEKVHRLRLEEIASSTGATCADTQIDSPSEFGFADTLVVESDDDFVEPTQKLFPDDAEQAVASVGHLQFIYVLFVKVMLFICVYILSHALQI